MTNDNEPAEGHPTRAARRAAQPGRGIGRAYGLTALGTLVPGAGLVLTRRRMLGIPLLIAAIGTLAFVLFHLARNGAFRSALDLASRPGLLRMFAVILVIGGLIWIGSIVVTALTARPRRMSSSQKGGLTAFTAAMCLVIAAPALIGLRYIDAHTDAVETIFTGSEDRVEDPDRPSVGPQVEEEDPWADVPRVNVLLLGSDAADSREGVRTDSMMVASIDTATGDMVLFGIPRNLQNVPIPESSPLRERYGEAFDCGTECLMNGVWTAAEDLAVEQPELFAEDATPGQTATRQVIAEVLGQPIDYTVIIDLDGFKELVDAMGGVTINVQDRIPLGGQTWDDAAGNPHLVEGTVDRWIETGEQHLNGYEALWYARSRVTTDDFSRMRRQRCVVGALVDQANPMNLLQRYPSIAAAAGDNIKVDIHQSELPAWAELVERVQDGGSMQSLPFTPENINPGNPDFEAIRAEVEEAITPPEPEPAEAAPSTGGPDGEGGADAGAGEGTDEAGATTAPDDGAPDDGAPEDGDQAEGPDQEDTTGEPAPDTDELADLSAVC